MTIQEVLVTDTPNNGRSIWNANDLELEARINRLALNVKQPPFNAVGDGSADDQPALQTAIDTSYALGGGHVFLPNGTYQIGKTLLLRGGVSLIGGGMYDTTIRLADGVNTPVIADQSAGVAGEFAFGRVYLAHFGIDGNSANNPGGQEGIFTTAYYSTFENLYIHDCQTHGIRMGFSGMGNASSQNRIAGCRISRCAEAGIYLDINGIDHTISENYIHHCKVGIVIRNGGIRVVNNAIYGHQAAGVLVTQTSYGSIISANDFNANLGHGIHITRTSSSAERPWSMMLIWGNSILGDALQADNLYDGIYVESPVSDGINRLTIGGNKVFTLDGPSRYRYGINLESNVTQTRCTGNHLSNYATAPYNVGLTCTEIEIDSLGTGVLAAPDIPASETLLTNPFHAPVTVYVAGGTVTGIAVGGLVTGLVRGSFRLPAGQSIALTYVEAPTWTWVAD